MTNKAEGNKERQLIKIKLRNALNRKAKLYQELGELHAKEAGLLSKLKGMEDSVPFDVLIEA